MRALDQGLERMKTIAAAVVCVALTGCAGALALDAKLQCATEPDRAPARTRGEFPFRLTYVSQGQRHVLEDATVCQLKRASCDASGRPDTWTETLKSGRPDVLIHSVRAGEMTRQFLASTGGCSVLMEQASYHREEANPIYAVKIMDYQGAKPIGGSGGAGATAALKALGIEIVAFEQWSGSAADRP